MAAAYLAIANEANKKSKKLAFWTVTNEDVGSKLADQQNAKAILLDARGKLASINWSDSTASAAAAVVAGIDTIIGLINEDPPDGRFFFLAQAYMTDLPGIATNVLRTQIGLPAIPHGCPTCDYYTGPDFL